VKRRLMTTTAVVLVLLAGAAAVYFSSQMKSTISDRFAEIENPSKGQVLAFNVMSLLPSIIVVLVNIILTLTIWTFERISLYSTTTDLQAAVTRNLALAQFINTALVAIPIHWKDWYGRHGLVVEIYNVMISNAVVGPLLYLLSPVSLYKKLKFRLARSKADRCLLSQLEANVLHEAPPVDMPALCAGMMKTCCLSLMYAPLLPIGLAIGTAALILQYWASKYMLLRRHKRPVRLSDELDEIMLSLLPYGIAAYAATNFYFFYDLSSLALIPGAVGCGLVFLYLFTPIKKMLKVWVKRSISKKAMIEAEETPKTYEESVVDFFQDYDRENPVTAAEGRKWWLELINRQKGEEAAQVAGAIAGGASLRSFAKAKGPVAKTYINQKRQAQSNTQTGEGDLVKPCDLVSPKAATISNFKLALIKKGHKKSSKGALDGLVKKK